MSFEPQNDLERSLAKAASDPAHRPQFYKDLSQSDIFIVQHGKQPPVQHTKTTLAEGTTIQIQNIEHNGKPHTLIALDVSEKFDEVSAEAGIVIRNVSIPDPPVDFMPITGKGGLDDYFVKETKPFYERRFLGLF